MTPVLLAALRWEPQVKGGLYVMLAVLILCGSAYLLLSTNLGARLGFLVAAAGLFGWLSALGVIWWVYGRGPVGRAPVWKSEGVVVGNLARSRNDALEHFPRGWHKLPLSDPEVADAQPIVDGEIVSAPGKKKMFASGNDYLPLAAYEKGGEAFGPLGLDFRPLNVFHKAHYIVIQVQKKAPTPPPTPGQPPPRAQVDPSAQPVAVVVVRDLGTKRLNPAVFALSSMAIFGLLCYQLHTRDKEAEARRQAEAQSPELVSR